MVLINSYFSNTMLFINSSNSNLFFQDIKRIELDKIHRYAAKVSWDKATARNQVNRLNLNYYFC
jgi:hypothetical protein